MDALIWIAAGVALALSGLAAVRRLWGFRAQRPEDYAGGPVLDIRRHLSGPLLCEGVIYGPTGRVTSRFVAELDGRWEGGVGHLAERFAYDSGRVQDRAWRLTVGAGGGIVAEADDIVGRGIGRQKGSAARLDYRIRLDPEAGGHVLDVTDWMYLAPNGTILNRSQFRKFGLKVAELIATMRPLPQADRRDAAA